jgi:hypothetical protein
LPWSAFAALVVALAALVVAILGWFHPSTDDTSSKGHNKQQAKESICAATGAVREAVGRSTNVPQQENPVAALAVASNARLGLYAGGGYLHHQLAEEPSAPKDLKKAISAYADTLQELSINYLAGASPTDAVQQPLRDQLNSQLTEIDKLCQ